MKKYNWWLLWKKIYSNSKKKDSKNGRFIEINGASGNNLKKVNLKIPVGTFTCVTGVSGSGKSTLILHTLYNAFNLMLNKIGVGRFLKLLQVLKELN